jgi:hypothetical protein
VALADGHEADRRRSSITVFCAVVVRTRTGTSRTGEAGFRDRLCEAIGRNVTSTEADDSAVRIGMDDCTIEIDLAADFTGPEKLLLHDGYGRLAVWV